jgi:D-alanyl-D-alanine carboxypeptidase
LATSDISLTRETFEAANSMFKQAQSDGVKGFTITSGYRTEEKQQELYENDTDGTAAMPGASEHETGLAFDVTTRYDSGEFDDTEQFLWLSEHCWDFGFILRYPKDKEDITGIPYEPWHYRYVGVEIAKEIHENGWTLEEYCERNED